MILFVCKRYPDQVLFPTDVFLIANFGPRNVPNCLKNVEIMGILQARKWSLDTLTHLSWISADKPHFSGRLAL